MKKISITHIRSGIIHVIIDNFNFIIANSNVNPLDVVLDKKVRLYHHFLLVLEEQSEQIAWPDFVLSEVLPEELITDSSVQASINDIQWFSNHPKTSKAVNQGNVHLLKTDSSKKFIAKNGRTAEIWSVGIGWVIGIEQIRVLFTEKTISSDREAWPQEKQDSKLWRYGDLREKFGIFDLRIVDFTSQWVPTDSGEMFEYDCTKKTVIVHSKNLEYSKEAFHDFEIVLQFSEDAPNFITLDEGESKEIEPLTNAS